MSEIIRTSLLIIATLATGCLGGYLAHLLIVYMEWD